VLMPSGFDETSARTRATSTLTLSVMAINDTDVSKAKAIIFMRVQLDAFRSWFGRGANGKEVSCYVEDLGAASAARN
jgi:hypothetical protein